VFSKTTSPNGYQTTSSTYNPALTGNAPTYTVSTGTPSQYWGDAAVIAYGFDNYKGGETLDADGISVLGQAGSQIVSLLRINPYTGAAASVSGAGLTVAQRAQIGSGVTPNIHLERTRYLVLRMGSLRVEGV